MIQREFNTGIIATVDFGATLASGRSYFVPTDEGVQNTLRGILRDTVDTINNIPGDWEEFDVSEDYGDDVPLSFHPAATRVLGLVTPRSVG